MVPYREEMAKRHLKVTGDLGRVVFIVRAGLPPYPMNNCLSRYQEYDLRNTESIEEAVRHSDVVYNLVGRTYPTKYDPFRKRPKDPMDNILTAVVVAVM